MTGSSLGTVSSGMLGYRFPIRLILSYLFDWIVCFAFVGIGAWLDRIAPAKRAFSLIDASISFMKNLFGKPRPDLLSRCDPDWSNIDRYLVGGFKWRSMTGQLVSADICRQTDRYKIDDGFRSFPSGHSSAAAGGLVYASLFMASKFAITIPFILSPAASAASHAAFPSQTRTGPVVDLFELSHIRDHDGSLPFPSTSTKERAGEDDVKVQPLRRQAAAPPIYLLALGLLPFGVSIFIAGSRWHDRRHHGFDILFGYAMGLIASIFAFRYYHLPIRAGAGWAWGPRSDERAFWAGIGRQGYAGTDEELGIFSVA
ncbi:hypothetical protein FPRO04_13577 [Fusarium proliferatum]|nr:hypothetical protein FPRO04_13577 [Fusarium proliferatum]